MFVRTPSKINERCALSACLWFCVCCFCVSQRSSLFFVTHLLQLQIQSRIVPRLNGRPWSRSKMFETAPSRLCFVYRRFASRWTFHCAELRGDSCNVRSIFVRLFSFQTAHACFSWGCLTEDGRQYAQLQFAYLLVLQFAYLLVLQFAYLLVLQFAYLLALQFACLLLVLCICATFCFSLLDALYLCASHWSNWLRGQVRIAHLGGYFSVPPGFETSPIPLQPAGEALSPLLIWLLTVRRTFFALQIQNCGFMWNSFPRSPRQHYWCKCRHRLDVQAASSSNHFYSHVIYTVALCVIFLSGWTSPNSIFVRWNVGEGPSKGVLRVGSTSLLSKVFLAVFCVKFVARLFFLQSLTSFSCR